MASNLTSRTSPFYILLAEDNPADARLVEEALKEHHLDCTLHLEKNGAQAIAFLEDIDRDPSRPQLDLLLLDMHLPRYDGEHILRTLRATESYAQTPVIVMTASDSPRDYERAQKHAALHYFRKPSSLAEFMTLGQIVRDILQPVPQETGGPKGGVA